VTAEELARHALGDLFVDDRSLEIIGARVLMTIRAALAEEREACARAVEEHACQHGTICADSWAIAAAIRARA